MLSESSIFMAATVGAPSGYLWSFHRLCVTLSLHITLRSICDCCCATTFLWTWNRHISLIIGYVGCYDKSVSNETPIDSLLSSKTCLNHLMRADNSTRKKFSRINIGPPSPLACLTQTKISKFSL